MVPGRLGVVNKPGEGDEGWGGRGKGGGWPWERRSAESGGLAADRGGIRLVPRHSRGCSLTDPA